MDIRSTGSTAVDPRMLGRVGPAPLPATQQPNIKAVPVQTAEAVDQAASIPSVDKLNDAVGKINETMRSLSQGVEFSIDPDSDRTIVKVIDRQSNQVLRQFPSEEMLEIAKALDRLQGLLISQKA